MHSNPSPQHRAAANLQDATRSLQRPSECAYLTVILAVYLIAYWSNAEDLYRTIVLAGAIGLMAVLGTAAYSMAARNPVTIWTPLFWFRIACAAYFGFGAMVPYIVDETTLRRIYEIYPFDDRSALKVSIIYTLGILLTLAAANFVLKRSGRVGGQPREESGLLQRDRTMTFAILFLSIGGLLRYGIVIPYTFGLFGDTVVPGAIITIANCYYVGIYLLIRAAATRGLVIGLIAAVLVAFDFAVSIASFAKAELLTLLIFALLGVLSYRVSLQRVAVGASLILVSYMAFQPLVQFGRDVIYVRYGAIRGAPLSERMDIVEEYLRRGSSDSASGSQASLSRLSYVNVSAYVVEQYDAGRPGNTLINALAVIVPRALWPDKPIISALGEDLYLQATGRRGSSIGVGHFAEAYWNFGWLGLPLCMIPLGAVMAIFSQFSIQVMSRQDWLFLPVVLMGVDLGIRADGHFAVDVLGPTWTALVLGLSLYLISLPFRNQPPSGYRRSS